MAAALDRSRPFAAVCNDDLARFYEQDGVFFNADGSEWQPAPAATLDEAKPVRRAKAAEATPAPTAATPAVDAELAAQLGQA